MSSARWQARIRTVNGAICGAGVLVTSDKVLTCAHVVSELYQVKVEFPEATNAGSVLGAVAWRGPWKQPGDEGDVAVIALDGVPPGTDPCKFADLDALRPRSGVNDHAVDVRGFPLGYESHGGGSHVTVRTSARRILGEWLQVDVDKDQSKHLLPGFSGAGVCLLESGAVVGILTDADKVTGRTGLMLPLSTLRRYWDELDDLLPLTWLEPRECRRELRALIAGAYVAPDLRTVVAAALPLTSKDPINSLWEAIRFVGECGIGDDGLLRFLVMLVPHMDQTARASLTTWVNTWKSGWSQEVKFAKPPFTSVVVTMRTLTKRGNSQVEITARPLVNGQWIAPEETVTARRDQVEEKVEDVVSAQVARVRPRKLMIEFAVEGDDLRLPFDEWKYREPGIPQKLPMLSVPLVVWDVSRLDPASITASERVRERWENLRGRGQTRLESVTCDLPYGYEEFYNWLNADESVGAIAYASSPKGDWLDAARNVGIPVMVWCRQQCDGDSGSHDEHLRHLGQLTEALSGTDPSALPAQVASLRKKAMNPRTEGHCGRHLTLFWDDPARLPLPDPPLTSWS